MAKKGQKFSKYTLEEKQKFIKMVREEGYSTYEITREFGIPNSSIKNWLYSPEKVCQYPKEADREMMMKLIINRGMKY